jgi:hypothetical protein
MHASLPRGSAVSGRLMSSPAPEEITGLCSEKVVRNAPVAIAVIDSSGRVINSNPRTGTARSSRQS